MFRQIPLITALVYLVPCAEVADPKEQGGKLAVGAKVLIDPSKEEPYTQSINRAEIKIDIQTDQY